jgi:hypothetical protein
MINLQIKIQYQKQKYDKCLIYKSKYNIKAKNISCLMYKLKNIKTRNL